MYLLSYTVRMLIFYLIPGAFVTHQKNVEKISGAHGLSVLTTTIYFVHTFLSDSKHPRKHTPGTVGKGFTMSAHVNFHLKELC